MNARTTLAAAVAAAMMAMTVSLFAADAPAQKSEPIYGYRMMSDPERDDYRARMRNAKSADERQSIRDEHRKAMEARAKERGVTLPEPRGPRGDGRGPGYGPGGQGKGYGPQGKGPGYGPGARGECPAGQECPGPGTGKGPGYGPGGKGPGYGPEGKGRGYGPGGQGMGYGPQGKGPGYGPGARGECPAGQECPGPGGGKGPGYGPGSGKGPGPQP